MWREREKDVCVCVCVYLYLCFFTSIYMYLHICASLFISLSMSDPCFVFFSAGRASTNGWSSTIGLRKSQTTFAHTPLYAGPICIYVCVCVRV